MVCHGLILNTLINFTQCLRHDSSVTAIVDRTMAHVVDEK